MDRRKFLASASVTALSVSVFGKIAFQDGEFEGPCETTDDILGPFYRENAPTRADLTYEGLEGTVVNLKGSVFDEDCNTPLEGACVEIWHCNTEGDYDNKSDKFLQRAKWYTDEQGKYSFKTILPGKYLNGSQYRPAHIHCRVTSKNNKELISQLYFQGDPHIANHHWASQKKAELRILPIIMEDVKGGLTVRFDIYLSRKK